MALESTAINDLIAGLQQRPLQSRDSDNWLFGEPERDDATEIDTGREDKSTTPFDRVTPEKVVSLPQSFGREPSHAVDQLVHRPSSPTTYVRAFSWSSFAKKAALPIGLFCIVIVLIGLYFAKSETKPVAAAAEPAEPEVAMTVKAEAVAPAPEPTTIPPPVVTPIEQDKPVVTPIEQDMPVVTPDEPVAKPVEVAKPEPTPPPAPEPVTVEPGSPASRFLGSSSAGPTVPTVAAKAAPAPTTVADLPPPPAAKEPVKAPAEELGVKIAATPVKAKKKSAAQLRAEKRAAAKRATKASAAAKARAKRAVAARSDDDADEDDEEEAPAKKAGKGKGVLSVASSPAMEVWVDGRNSGAQTPVRIILLAGKHKVTLFDKANAKARSFEIEIKPDATTKVVKNYE